MMNYHDPHQHIFRALADPTRRAILSMLSQGERPIGEIASEFEMTRPAVAKHLKILKEGDLISITEAGRERIHSLNPTPLKSASDWLNFFDQFWDDKLTQLKTQVEQSND
ncbi:ArsR/SmtB family transcription factor [Hirschia maritima]|uniref:ArsR/SmtB family transcription factor n=1 Tax=Hirschia maritima TaxID=1121961 RepID=UPI00037375D3|nr:metalloregulator ArsR/SmtB family transcription factor [Hirschia maritima]